MKIPDTLIVHGGVFHADDVGVFAVLRILNPHLQVIRVNKVPNTLPENTLVADIGNGRYDHHQPDAEIREDGVKHCALSLVWLDFGAEVVEVLTGFPVGSRENIKVYKFLYDGLLKAISIQDNGGEICVESTGSRDAFLGSQVNAFLPTWEEDSSPAVMDSAFVEAADFFEGIFCRLVKKQAASAKSQSLAEEYCQKSNVDETGIVVLEHFVPWQGAVCSHKKALFVVYPSLRGGWNIQAVPTKPGARNSNRIELPVAWRGLEAAEASAVCAGMTFCHAGGFLATFTTRTMAKDIAMMLVKKATKS